MSKALGTSTLDYRLWIDDQALDMDVQAFRRPPLEETDWLIAISSKQACSIVQEFGIPYFIEFDHDLGKLSSGDNDTSMYFLHWISYVFPEAIKEIKGWNIHSMNPEGAKNIEAFMNSWRKSINL